MSNVLIIPPTMYGGSLGDQALVLGAQVALAAYGKRSVLFLTEEHAGTWEISGGRLLGSVPVSLCDPSEFERTILPHYDELVLLGADVLDGAYNEEDMLRYVRFAKAIDMPASIVSFSLREALIEHARKAEIRDLINKGVKFVCRDGLTHSRMCFQFGNKPALFRNAADLSLLCPSLPPPPEVVDFIIDAKAVNANIVGICLKASDEFGQQIHKVATLRDTLAKSISKLSGSSCVLFFVHDERGSDREFSQEIAEEFPFQNLVVGCYASRVIRGCTPFLDLAISFRMHFGLACLANYVPVFVFEYNDKMAGAFGMAGASEMVIKESLFKAPNLLADRLIKWDESDYKLTRRRLRHTIPGLIRNAYRNFGG